MMSVINDYKCPVHGYFEGREAVCPAGCTDVSVVFLKPIGVKSDSTKHNDRTLNQLALDFKMGDIKSTREGEAQPPRHAKPNNPFAPRWGSPGDIGGYNLNSINGEAVSGMQAVKQSGANLSGPKIGSYIADHENLKIQK
jgi:hypothetical protein